MPTWGVDLSLTTHFPQGCYFNSLHTGPLFLHLTHLEEWCGEIEYWYLEGLHHMSASKQSQQQCDNLTWRPLSQFVVCVIHFVGKKKKDQPETMRDHLLLLLQALRMSTGVAQQWNQRENSLYGPEGRKREKKNLFLPLLSRESVRPSSWSNTRALTSYFYDSEMTE